jgi:hypothetical protein
MPEICRFYGIVIQIYYGEEVAKVAIETLQIIEGTLPQRALVLVREWAKIHEQELLDAFKRATAFQPPGKIAPLE